MLLVLVLAVAPVDGSLEGPVTSPRLSAATTAALSQTWFLARTWTTKTNGVLEFSAEGARLFDAPSLEGTTAGIACSLTSKVPLAYSRLRLASSPWLIDGRAVTFAPVQAKPERLVLTPFFSNAADKDPVLETLFAAMTLGASLVRLVPEQARDLAVALDGPPPWRGATGKVAATCRPVTQAQVDGIAGPVLSTLDRCADFTCVAHAAALVGPWDTRVEAAARRVARARAAEIAERFATAGHQPVSATVLRVTRCGARCAALAVRNDLPVAVGFDVSEAMDHEGNTFPVAIQTELPPASTTVVRVELPGVEPIAWPVLVQVIESSVTVALPRQFEIDDWYVDLGTPSFADSRWQLPATVEAFGPRGPLSLDVLWPRGAPQFTDGWGALMAGPGATLRSATLSFPAIDGQAGAAPVAARLRVRPHPLVFVAP
jgi:hypothetical protein